MRNLFLFLSVVLLLGGVQKLVPAGAQTVTPLQSQGKVTFTRAGVYKVGSEIPAGRYFILVDSDMGYWEIAKDSTGSLESIVSNDTIFNFCYVDLKSGDYFQVAGAKFVLRDAFANLVLADPSRLMSGQYLVGKDIEAGEYKLTSEGDLSYWARSKDARGVLTSIIANDNFTSQTYVTVKAGEFFTVTYATAVRVK